MELKLTCTYEEWLKNKCPRLVPKKQIESISEESAKLMEMAFNSMTRGEFTKEERAEFDKLSKEQDEKLRNEKYTDLYYTIVDMCINPKGCKPDFKEIGKKQCEMVRIIYPIVIPKKEKEE